MSDDFEASENDFEAPENDFEAPELEDPELPDMAAQLVGGGFEKDFADVLRRANAQQPTRGVPPIHPTVTISDEEMQTSIDAKQDRSLFPNAKTKKLRCEVGLYDLSDEIQKTEYQNIINNALQKGWLLVRDDWQRTPEGGAFAAVKILIPEKSRRQKKKDGSNEHDKN